MNIYNSIFPEINKTREVIIDEYSGGPKERRGDEDNNKNRNHMHYIYIKCSNIAIKDINLKETHIRVNRSGIDAKL